MIIFSSCIPGGPSGHTHLHLVSPHFIPLLITHFCSNGYVFQRTKSAYDRIEIQNRIFRLEESNAYIQKILNSMKLFLDCLHFPIAIINVEGRYVYYNEESAEIDGCSREFALGNLLLNVYKKMRPEESTMLQSLQTGRCYSSHEQNYFNARGKLLNYMHTTTPLFNQIGQTVGAIEIGWDVSQITKLQNQILLLTKKLQSRQNKQIRPGESSVKIITRSPLMLKIIEDARMLAASNVPVVIMGESGTGKELIAQLIQSESNRKNNVFVTLNCGALTETLIDSSLFGTIKGAFTGADNSQGYLEFANGGTLFLDEFNSMPPSMQVKLLRFLQNRTFSRVGSPKQLTSDVRIIVAMNENPLRLIEKGTLRADLYWRLCVGQIELPPLRERREDIPLLVEYFIAKYAADVAHHITGVTQNVLDQLMAKPWPGNIRMLENTVLRTMVMQKEDGPISEVFFDTSESDLSQLNEDFPKQISEELPASLNIKKADNNATAEDLTIDKPYNEMVDDFERKILSTALKKAKGNVSEASSLLGVNRSTLNYKLKKLGIPHGFISRVEVE